MSSERWNPAVPSVAMRIASSMTVRRPRSSMSRMVKARTPESRTLRLLHLVHVAQADDHGVARVDFGW